MRRGTRGRLIIPRNEFTYASGLTRIHSVKLHCIYLFIEHHLLSPGGGGKVGGTEI